MKPPSRDLEPGAFVADWGDETHPDDLPPPDRAEVIAEARRVRTETGGLAIDEDTLQRVADAVCDPGYPYPGLFLTAEECRDEVPEEVAERVRDYAHARPDVYADHWVGWKAGKRSDVRRVHA